MKYFTLIILFTFVPLLLQAQDRVIPAKEFVLRAATGAVEVSRGNSSKVEVAIIRSKSYQKPEARLSLGSAVPAGITVTYEPATGVTDHSTVLIAVSEQAAPGSYNLIVNCTVKYKTKGVILKLNVL